MTREQLFDYLRDKFEPCEVIELLQDAEELDMEDILDALGDRLEEHQELFLDEYYEEESED